MKKFKNIRHLKDEILSSPEMQDNLKNDPISFFSNITPDKPPMEIHYIFIIVVVIVGLTLFSTILIGGIIMLEEPAQVTDETGSVSFLYREIPEFIIMLGSTALGALTGLLVPTPRVSNNQE